MHAQVAVVTEDCTGTLAAFTRTGDPPRLNDIDPDVVAASRSTHPQFEHLADAWGEVNVVLGDARISLQRELDQLDELGSNQFDLL